MLSDWLVFLIRLLVRLLLRLLRAVVLAGAVVLHPALLLVATFGAYSVEWGSTVLPLVRVWSELLRGLLILQVLWRHLRYAGVLLEEGVEAWAGFVLLDRGWQLLLGPVALMVLLRRCIQTRRVLRLIFLGPDLSAASGRLASPNCVLARLLCGVFVFVPACESSSNAAESRLFLRLLRVHGYWLLLRAWANLVKARWMVLRAGLLLVALQLIVRAQSVALGGARRALGMWLLQRSILLLLLRDTKRGLLQRGLLAELCLLLPTGILELVVHCASAYGQPHELPPSLDLQPRTYQREWETVAQTYCQQTCATCSTTLATRVWAPCFGGGLGAMPRSCTIGGGCGAK